MNKYHYVGPETRLGRFGPVGPGDVLDLTAKEQRGIQDDERFRVYDPQAKFGAADSTEARKDEIKRANLRTGRLSLDELSRDELLDMAAGLRGRGKKVVFNSRASRRALRSAIQQALDMTREDE